MCLNCGVVRYQSEGAKKAVDIQGGTGCLFTDINFDHSVKVASCVDILWDYADMLFVIRLMPTFLATRFVPALITIVFANDDTYSIICPTFSH